MRTALFLISGFLLLGACAILVKLFSGHYAQAASFATGVFLVVWFALTAFNLWVGMSHAGYSFAAEAPIWLLLFGVPAAAALTLQFKFY